MIKCWISHIADLLKTHWVENRMTACIHGCKSICCLLLWLCGYLEPWLKAASIMSIIPYMAYKINLLLSRNVYFLIVKSHSQLYLYFFIYTTFSLSCSSPFIHRLLPCLDSVTWVCTEHACRYLLRRWFCFGYIARSRLAGLYGNSILNFLRHLHSFPNGYTTLHSYNSAIRAPFSCSSTNTCYLVFFT